MGKYLRASKHLKRVRLEGRPFPDVLRALQESTSLKELSIHNLEVGILANKALETFMIRTRSLEKAASVVDPQRTRPRRNSGVTVRLDEKYHSPSSVACGLASDDSGGHTPKTPPPSMPQNAAFEWMCG
jgi:hypothetical protein